MPGAVQRFAASLKVTVPEMYKMMEAGKVTSDSLAEFGKILEEQAKQGGALQIYAASSMAAQVRLKSAWNELKVVLMTNGLDKALSVLFDKLAKLLDIIVELLPWIINIAAAFVTWRVAIMAIHFVELTKDIWLVVKAIWALNAALGVTTGGAIAAGFTKFLAMMQMIGRVVFLTWAPVLFILDTIWGMFSEDLSLIEYGVKKLGISDKVADMAESVVKGLGLYPGQEGTPEGAMKYEAGDFYPNYNVHPINTDKLQQYNPIKLPSVESLTPKSAEVNQQSVIINVNGGDLTSVRKVVEESVSDMMGKAKTTYNNRVA